MHCRLPQAQCNRLRELERSRGLGKEETTGSDGLGQRRHGSGDDRNAERHRFDRGNAQPLVMAHRHEEIRTAVQRGELDVGHAPAHLDRRQHELARELGECMGVLTVVTGADEDEPNVAAVIRGHEVRGDDELVESFVRHHLCDAQHQRARIGLQHLQHRLIRHDAVEAQDSERRRDDERIRKTRVDQILRVARAVGHREHRAIT